MAKTLHSGQRATNRPSLHPACKIFPPLGKVELAELASDIADNGLRNPIVMLNGKILDGRNRLAACKIAKVKPRFVEFKGNDPIGWVVSQNLVRRHLTASQKAVVAFDLLPLLEKEAKQRQRRSNSYRGNGRLAQDCANQEKGKAAEIAARITHSSSRYVEKVKSISRQAPELVEKIRTGELSVVEAERYLSYAARSRNGKKKRRTKISEDDAARIRCGDALKLIPELDDDSVSLVLTSPPYAEQRSGQYKGIRESKYPAWAVDWMAALWDKLTEDANVLIVIRPHIKNGSLSDYVLRTRLALRDDGWTECDELIWAKPDAPPLGNNKRPRRTWESVLWFAKTGKSFCDATACGRVTNRIGFAGSLRFGTGIGKPIKTGQMVEVGSGVARTPDVFKATISENPSIQHPAMFPVSLAEQLILTFSRPSDTVLDPFCGSGTTLCAAKKHGRDFLGFEISRNYVGMAKRRLADV